MGDRARRAGYRFGYYVAGPLITMIALAALVAGTFALAGVL